MTAQQPSKECPGPSSDVRHQEILDAASGLLAAEGPGGLTMQRVAEKTGCSVGYIYKHFPGKRELLAEILDRQFEVFLNQTMGISSQTAGSPLKAIRERMHSMTRQLVEQPDLVPVLLSVAESYPEKMKRREEPLHLQNQDLFRQAMAQGEVRRDDPVLLECAFSGMMWGLTIHLCRTGRMAEIETLPDLVDELLLRPLEIEQDTTRKEDTRDGNA